jgi:hypothetical protein
MERRKSPCARSLPQTSFLVLQGINGLESNRLH